MLRSKISPPSATLALTISVVSLGWLFSTGDVFGQDNQLFVSVSAFTGSTRAPRFVGEVNADRTVTELFSVPAPPGSANNFDRTRDLVVDQSGNVLVYNGTFSPLLLSGNAVDGIVSQTAFNFSSINNGTYGGIARQGNNVFLTDQSTGNSPDQGILRVNLDNNSTTRFAETIEPLDLNIAGGVVYALNGAGSPRNEVFRYDLETLDFIDEVPVAFADHRAVAGLADGTFFTATSDGDIFHYDTDGTLLNSANLAGAFFADIDIAPDGQIALGTAQSGNVVLTDISLSSFETFRVTESSLGGNTFVAFATDFTAVPEPSSGLLLLSIGTFLSMLRRKSS